MDKRIAALLVFCFLLATLLQSQTPGENSLRERVGDTGFVRVEAESFGSLTAKQQQLAYWQQQLQGPLPPLELPTDRRTAHAAELRMPL